ncbi:MAG: AAA family ATPase, partial [Anaerolineae bacterium]|nr:AAA family ATPase [Anaerolineae bacterium]
FIDEIDAVGRKRGSGMGGGHDEREQTLNQILVEMDGFETGTNVIVLAATNRPDVLDPALLRPGRFDRQVTVDLPDRQGRLEILKIHTRGKPLADNVDLSSLAGATVGFSGADIANLANEAALKAARDNKRRIEQSDFSYAFERIILGNERPPLSNMEERRVVAYHEAGHAVVSAFTPLSNPVLKVTITPRGQALGVTAYAPDEDIRNISRKRIESYLDGLLGGRVAEEIVFGDITTGASNDLQRVTSLARNMVAQYGMTDAVGPMNFGDDDQQPFLGYSLSQGRKYSEETAAKIDAETRRIVETAYKRTKALLAEHREDLEKVAQALLDREVLERDEFLEILGLQDKRAVEAAKLLDRMKDDGVPPVPPETAPYRPEQVQETAEAASEEPKVAEPTPSQSVAEPEKPEVKASDRRLHPSAQTPVGQPKQDARPKPVPKSSESRQNVPAAHPLFDSLFGANNNAKNHEQKNKDDNGTSDNKDA